MRFPHCHIEQLGRKGFDDDENVSMGASGAERSSTSAHAAY